MRLLDRLMAAGVPEPMDMALKIVVAEVYEEEIEILFVISWSPMMFAEPFPQLNEPVVNEISCWLVDELEVVKEIFLM